MAGDTSKVLGRFKGLNNVNDPMRGPVADQYGRRDSWEWQSVADNIDITDASSVVLRKGYTSFLVGTDITASYSTAAHTHLFIIDNGVLKKVFEDGSVLNLATGLEGTAYWTEINSTVYLSCGVSKYQIDFSGEIAVWGVPTPSSPNLALTSGHLYAGSYQVCVTYSDSFGREGGASLSVLITLPAEGGISITDIPTLSGYAANVYVTDMDGTVFYLATSLNGQTALVINYPVLGRELTTDDFDVPPDNSTYMAPLNAILYVAEYFPSENQTVFWATAPMGYHLFNYNSDYFILPGEVTQVFGANIGLVITTHLRIYVYDNEKIVQVAEYGAVPGQHADLGADGKVYFWTKRGLCKAAPFENLTESNVSVAPGTYAGGGVINMGGYQKYIAVIKQGGDAYNRR